MILSKEIVNEIKKQSDVISIVGDYVRSLKRSGKNWIGLCPFHNDKSPSFSISESYGLYRCFACGESGDIIKFIEKVENLTFKEALSFLARRAGLNIENINNYGETTNKREDYVNFNLRLVKLFQFFLLETEDAHLAKNYLEKRGIDKNIVELFQIGYAPKGYGRLENILRKRGFNDSFLLESGLFTAGKGEIRTLFFDRVIFPIFNHRNECVAFGGRVINDDVKPKYLNSPETLLYKKSQNLYGLNFTKEFIKKEKKVFVVEGYMDVISCYKNGVKNVVAPCGTALTKDQVTLLSRYCDEVVLLLDRDEAGLKGAVKALNEFANIENINSNVLILSHGKDPDDYFKHQNLDDFTKLEKEKISGFDFLIDYKMRDCNRENYQDLIGVLNFLFEYILLWSSEVVKDGFINKLAQKLNIDKGIILKEMGNHKIKKHPRYKGSIEESPKVPKNNFKRILSLDEENELDLLLVLDTIPNGREIIRQCGLTKDFFYYEGSKTVFLKYFTNNLSEKQNILDFFDDDNQKEYLQRKIFSEELKFDENLLVNNAIDRIFRVMSRFYERKKNEIGESIKIAELYKDDGFIRELMEDKEVMTREILKLKKLQELKK